MDTFKEDLDKNLGKRNVYEYTNFQNTLVYTFNKHSPIKKEILRFNNNSFIIKALEKTIIHRSKF